MNHFPTYAAAAIYARATATATGLDIALRKASRYDAPGFIVSFASRNDSDYARAEIIRPGEPR